MGQAAACEMPMVDETQGSPANEYQRVSWRIYGLCRHLLGSHDAARDAVQEVFLRVQQANDRFDRTRPAENWVASIARNYCLDLLRHRQSEQRLFAQGSENLPEPASGAPSPLVELLARESKIAFRKALDKLPQPGREALMLRYQRELNYQAIAEQLGISRNQVGVLIFRAKEQLRGILQPAHKESAP